LKKLTREEFIEGLKDNTVLFEIDEQVGEFEEMAQAIEEHDATLAKLIRDMGESIRKTSAYVKATYGKP